MPHKKRSEGKKALSSFARGMGIGLFVILGVIAIGTWIQSLKTPKNVVSQQVDPSTQEAVDANSEISGKYYGLCEKNKIHSVEDFHKIVQTDPVLATHFSGFNWENARLGRQDRDIWTYVAYRKGNIIRRTSRAVKLPRGDGYVTDGSRVVRTFCCNDYVIAPPPAADNEAPPEKPVERVDAPPPPNEQ